LIPELMKRQVLMAKEQVTWSSNGSHILLYDTDHYVQFTKPNIVIDAIGEVVAAVQRE
jgi:hypothetical protein